MGSAIFLRYINPAIGKSSLITHSWGERSTILWESIELNSGRGLRLWAVQYSIQNVLIRLIPMKVKGSGSHLQPKNLTLNKFNGI